MPGLTVYHAVGEFVSVAQNGVELFRLDYASAPKPFLHPVATPSGHVLTNFQPNDHYWHRGLWFAFKFVNGENFWEEDPDGTPNTQAAIRPPTVESTEEGGLRLSLELEWTRHDGHVVMEEHRAITFTPIDDTAYLLDHDSVITAREDVTLDRTPFTTWGGYGGLCFRGTRNWTDSVIRLSDGTETSRPTGIPADWAVLTGKLDGDRNLQASVAILEHKTSFRSPTPWYGGTGIGLYLTPAPLFHEAATVAAGEEVRFRYRLVIAERELSSEELDQAYAEFNV